MQRCHGHCRHVQEAQRRPGEWQTPERKKNREWYEAASETAAMPVPADTLAGSWNRASTIQRGPHTPPRLWPIPKTAPDREQAMWWHVRNSPAPKRMLEGAAGGMKVETQASRQASGIRNPASNTPHKLITSLCWFQGGGSNSKGALSGLQATCSCRLWGLGQNRLRAR